MERRPYYAEPLLKRSYRCGDADLIDAIEVHDKAAVEQLVGHFVTLLRTPQACEEAFGSELLDSRARDVPTTITTTTTYNPHAQEEEVSPAYKVGDLPYGGDVAPAPPASWPEMRALLLQLCTQMVQLVAGGSSKTTSGVAVSPENGEMYQFPPRLQQQVVPLLYSWGVHFPLFLHYTDLWTDVVKCFCICARLPFTYGKERPSFSLPWRPVAGFLTSLVTELTSRTMEELAQSPFIMDVVQHEKGHLSLLATRARFFFDADALGEMWDYFAPFFAPSGVLSSVYLILFAELLPRLRLTDESGSKAPTSQPQQQKKEEEEEALPLVRRIVDFLYKDSFNWQRGDAGWYYGRMAVVQSLFAENVGLMDMHSFAEPFFTDVLNSLQLPIDDIAFKLPPVAFKEAFPMLDFFSLFRVNNNKNHTWLQMASAVVWMLPDDTTSPLWGQLRRFIRATGVFLHPGPQTTAGMERVHCVYESIISTAVRKMKRQHTFLTFDANNTNNNTAAGAGVVGEEGEEEEEEAEASEKSHVRPLPEAYLWSRSTVRHFVQLFTSDLLPALSFRWNPTANVLATVCSLVALDPETMFTALAAHLDIEHQMQLQTQQEMLVRILRRTAHHFLSCAATRRPFVQLIRPLVPSIPYWVSPSAVYVCEEVLGFAAMLSMYGVLEQEVLQGDEDAIAEFYQTMFHQVLSLFANSHQNLARSMAGAALLLEHMSEPFFARAAPKMWDEAAAFTGRNTQLVMVRLIAQRDPALALKKANAVTTPLLCAGSSNDEEISYAGLLFAETLYGVGREVAREQVHLVRRCIRQLLGNITSMTRVMTAGNICNGLVAALLKEPCTTVSVPSRDNDPSQKVETIFYDTHLLDGLHLCKATQVQFKWARPTDGDVDLIAQLFNELLGDALFTMEHVAEVAGPPSSAEAGLRGLQGLVPPDHETTAAAAAAAQAPFLPGLKAKPFTPYNVLVGLMRWVEILFTIHLPLYQRSDEPKPFTFHFRKTNDSVETETRYTLSAEPWWEKEQRTSYWVHFTDACPPKYSREYVSDFVLQHAARRVTADQSDLQQVCGDGVSELFQLRWLKEGKPPLPFTPAEHADAEGITRLLALLHVLHRTPATAWWRPVLGNLSTCGLIEDQYALPVESTVYMPVDYWRAQSEVIRRYHSRVEKPKSQPVFKDLMDFSHVLVFTNLRSKVDLVSWTDGVQLISPAAQSVFVQRHLEVLTSLAIRWIDKNKGTAASRGFQQALYGEETAAGPRGASAHVGTASEQKEAPPKEREEEEMQEKMKKERQMVHTLFRNAIQAIETVLASYTDTAIPLKHYIFLLKLKCLLPDEMFGKDDSRAFKSVSLSTTDAMQVLEELLPLAHRMAQQYPVRAVSLLSTLLRIYKPCVGKPLSPSALKVLFAICELHTFPRLHSVSCVFLCSALQALRPRPPRRYVLMRQEDLSEPLGDVNPKDKSYAPFSTRWAALKQQYPSFYLPNGFSQVFPARYLLVEKDIPSDFFQDGLPLEVDATCRVPASRFVGDDGSLTPDIVAQHEQQIQQIVLGELLQTRATPPEVSLEQTQQTWLGRVIDHQQSSVSERDPPLLLLGTVGRFMPKQLFVSCLLLLQQHYQQAVEPLKTSTAQTATEECLSLYRIIATLTVTALQATSVEEQNSAQHAEDARALRGAVMQSFYDSIVLFCHSIFPQSALYTKRHLTIVSRHVTPEEITTVLDFLFSLLTSADASAEGKAAADNNWLNARSEAKVLTMIETFLSVLKNEVMCVVLPHLLQAVRARPFLLALAAEQVRVKASDVLQHLVACNLMDSVWITQCGNAKVLCKEFLLFLEAQFPVGVLTEQQPRAVEENGGDSPNSVAPSDAHVARLKQSLPLIKTIVQSCCIYRTDDGSDGEHTRTLVRFIGLTLDASLPEADTVFTTVSTILLRVIGKRMSKPDANDLLMYLCDLLKGSSSSSNNSHKKDGGTTTTRCGHSRRARVMLTRSLRLQLYLNLHRIGKYATMSTVLEAAMASMAHIDGQLREEGALVCAVLSKVAAVEQMQALIRGIQQEMRSTHTVLTTATTAAAEDDKHNKRGGEDTANVLAAKRRFTAAAWALCAFASADPHKLPPYLPQVLQFLAPYAASCGVLEVRSKIKKTFERWWATHRDGWEQHYKAHFTAQQQEELLFLVKENSHYA